MRWKFLIVPSLLVFSACSSSDAPENQSAVQALPQGINSFAAQSSGGLTMTNSGSFGTAFLADFLSGTGDMGMTTATTTTR